MKNTWILFVIFLGIGCAKSSGGDSAGGSISTSQRSQAVSATVSSRSECSSLGDFYYEIGDSSGSLTSGSTGGGAVSSSTNMSLASGSKWYFGAYVLQLRNGAALSVSDYQALQMQTGYINFVGCTSGQTVDACYNTSTNNQNSAGSVNRFYYGGGHFEFWGHNNGLGTDNNAALIAEYKLKLGSDLGVIFTSPQFAGGMYGNASQYAIFLRKILNQQILMSGSLGAHPVCVNPSTCTTSDYAPVPESWHYSLGHWVEDDPTNGDGSFSSPGAFGFYPWIDSSKTYYGILARSDTANSGNPVATSSYWKSILCGRLLRKAWLSGAAQ